MVACICLYLFAPASSCLCLYMLLRLGRVLGWDLVRRCPSEGEGWGKARGGWGRGECTHMLTQWTIKLCARA